MVVEDNPAGSLARMKGSKLNKGECIGSECLFFEFNKLIDYYLHSFAQFSYSFLIYF